MLQPGMFLQNRYHILQRLGGGGMGVVYLAEDSRLPGRRCAIKEMSPDQLPAPDRNWAIQAFQQEAQMLANLKHPGLTLVTDYFPEHSNWYLVMDFIEGETLEARLAKAPGGRLPVEEALRITRQLCEVLTYLHNQNPPVIFRDLKPGNVMLTPQGDVKLIDFGIARFFKPGQTRDTVNLGTPGYAAPEQYGKMGLQSGPRADVYSLGALLLQMVTGYDPVTAPTPIPLPDPRSVMHTIPPHITAVITQATQIQPDLRYGSIREMQQALFPPTYTLPPQPYSQVPPSQRKSWLLPVIGSVGTIVVLAVCAVVAWASGLLPISPKTSAPTVAVATSPPTAIQKAIIEPTAEPPVVQSPTEDTPPTAKQQSTPTRMPRPTDTPIPSPTATFSWSTLAKSVKGRSISMLTAGYEGGTAVVVVGSIQGDQSPTTDLIQAVINNLERNQTLIPRDVAFYFIPSINPDGNAANSRFNANNVDLNRNWDTADWKSNAAVPGSPSGKAGAGGPRPFSEPETQALSDLLLRLKRTSTLRVVIFHTSVNSPNEVYAGGDRSKTAANNYATVMGYAIGDSWGAYTPTGEAITWCDEQGIISIDVIIPANRTPSVDSTIRALLEVAK